MKYLVRYSAMAHYEIEVEANSKREAEELTLDQMVASDSGEWDIQEAEVEVEDMEEEEV